MKKADMVSDFEITYKDGVAKFSVDEIFPEDKGTVECEAINEFGKAKTTCVLDVKGESKLLLFLLFAF